VQRGQPGSFIANKAIGNGNLIGAQSVDTIITINTVSAWRALQALITWRAIVAGRTLWASITAIALVAFIALVTLFTLRPLWSGWSSGASSAAAAARWHVSINNRSNARLNAGVFNVDPKRVCDAGVVINFAADAGSAQLSEKLVSVVGHRKAYASGHGLPLFAAVNF
jgi:hypothetical protein